MGSINKEMIPMKAHYFLFNAGTSPVVPFMPTLAKQLGFSSVVVGTIYTILPITGMLAKPLFGMIADRYQRHKTFFILSQLLTAITFFCIMFIPPTDRPDAKVNFDCNNGEKEIRYCPQNFKSEECKMEDLIKSYSNKMIECHMKCSAQPWQWDIICKNWNVTENCDRVFQSYELDVLIDMNHIINSGNCTFFKENYGIMNGKNTKLFCPTNESEYFSSECQLKCKDDYLQSALTENVQNSNYSSTSLYQFWLFLFLMITSWVGMAVAVSIGDAICFSLLGDQHHLYGNQRLWGAIGWGIFAIISGLLVDAMSDGSEIKDYTIVFWLALLLLCLDAFASSKIRKTDMKLSTNILKDIGKIFLSIQVIVFFLWCICVGLCTALIWNFLFWYLEDLAGNSADCSDNHMKTLQGLAMGVQCFAGELPFFFLSGWILKKIGHKNAMSLVLFGFAVRFLLYSILTNPWWVLPIEMMNGITFGIFYSTMASYASIIAPPGTEASLQGLVGAIFEGVGVSTGSFIGGIMFEKIGGAATFRIYGLLALVACVLHVLIQLILRRHYKNHNEYNSDYDAMTMLDEEET